MKEENIIFQYQVKKKTKFGTRYYYFYASTDIENYLNNKDIKYVRYAKDTALNKQAKRIKELFRENKSLQSQLKAKEEIISTALEVLEEKQRIYSDEQRLKQLEEYNSIEGVIEILRGNY